MSSNAGAPKRRSEFVLAAARALYLTVALTSLVIAGVTLVTAGYFEVKSWVPAKQLEVPAVYQVTRDSLDLSVIDAHFVPPSNIRFSANLYLLTQTLAGTEILGHFEADSANGLAHPPEDVDIIGGPDAARFVRVPYSDEAGHSGLQPSPQLVGEINAAFDQIKSAQSRSYRIQVIMRDRFGNISPPTDLTIKLYLAPPGTVSDTPDPNLSPLQTLAIEIAQIIDPSHGSKYVEAFKRAEAQPAACGEPDTNELFVANYRRAFEHVRTKISASTLAQFYLGVCDGWNLERLKIRASLNAKANVEVANSIAAEKAATESLIATAIRNHKLAVAGGAFVFFMFVSLLLAFLAIENHTRGMREALDAEKSKTP